MLNTETITQRAPEFHQTGWQLAFETPTGVVGLWSCWLGDQLVLCYPKSTVVTDRMIVCHLPVNFSRPVHAVNAITVDMNDPDLDMYKDADKPFEGVRTDSNRAIAYKSVGRKSYGEFYGKIRPGNKGRVWVSRKDFDSYMHSFSVVKDGSLSTVNYGHSYSNTIRTAPFGSWNQYAPEAPTTNSDAIEEFRVPFIKLAYAIAEQMGGILSVTVRYEALTVEPKDLMDFGCVRVPNQDEDCVYARRTSALGDEDIVLNRALCTWMCYRKLQWNDCRTVDDVAGLLTF
jgi:hypothetical protein